MKKINSGVGRRILKVRKDHGLTQGQFGKETGVTGQYILMLEKGQRMPSQGLIIAMASKFGVMENWLRTGRNR